MTRSPQPMRRMRYLIGEVISQRLVPLRDITVQKRLEDAMAWLGGEDRPAFGVWIGHGDGGWTVRVLFQSSVLFCAPLLTAPGPETALIGPELRPVVIQPRSPQPTTANLICG